MFFLVWLIFECFWYIFWMLFLVHLFWCCFFSCPIRFFNHALAIFFHGQLPELLWRSHWSPRDCLAHCDWLRDSLAHSAHSLRLVCPAISSVSSLRCLHPIVESTHRFIDRNRLRPGSNLHQANGLSKPNPTPCRFYCRKLLDIAGTFPNLDTFLTMHQNTPRKWDVHGCTIIISIVDIHASCLPMSSWAD